MADLQYYILPLKKFFNFLRPSRKDVFLLYSYSVFSGLVNLILPLGIQSIIGFIMGAQISFSLILLIGLVLAGVFFSGTLQVMQMYISESIQQKIFVNTAFEFSYKLPKFTNENLYKKYLPEVVNKFFDSVSLQKGLNKILIDFVSALFQVIFGLLLLSFYHPFFVFYGIFLVIVLILLIRITFPEGMRTSIEESSQKYKVVFWLEEIARNQKLFKLNNKHKLTLKKTDNILLNWLKSRKEHFTILVRQYWFLIIFKLLVTFGLLVIGTNLVFSEQINIGQFVASEIIIILLINSVEKLIMSFETIYDVGTSAEKLDQALSIPIESTTGYEFDNDLESLNIELKDVSVKSKINKKHVVQDINLNINQGDKIILSGKGGSGKSTLASLISGLIENYEGNILYNNVSLNSINQQSLYAHISGDFNVNSVFYGTLRENITLGTPISDDDLMKVLQNCQLKDFIETLENGFDTYLYPNDELLSFSLIKKIELARHFVNKPKLLIIEDFIGAMSKESETNILEKIFKNEFNWTVVFITNRKLFFNYSNRVIMMENGRILFDKLNSELNASDNQKFNDILI